MPPTPGVGAPWPRGGIVHLWSLPASRHARDTLAARGLALLSATERSRLSALRRPAARRRFLLGRALMRLVLADYLRCDPRKLAIGEEPGGKPSLDAAAGRGLAFSLAHSGNEVVLAVACAAAVGIDIEGLDRRASAWRIAGCFFAASERQALKRNAGAGETALKLWALKESIGKAQGTGVWDMLTGARLAIVDGKVRWLAPPPGGREADDCNRPIRTAGCRWATLARGTLGSVP